MPVIPELLKEIEKLNKSQQTIVPSHIVDPPPRCTPPCYVYDSRGRCRPVENCEQ